MNMNLNATMEEAGGFYDLYKQVAGPMLKAMGEAEAELPGKPQ